MEDLTEYLKERYAELEPAKAKAAEAFLFEKFSEFESLEPGVLDEIRSLHAEHGWEWIHHFGGGHFYFGMQVRNMLRMNGYGEAYFGVDNLDDYYIQLVEHALGVSE